MPLAKVSVSVLLALVAAAFLVVACGGDDGGDLAGGRPDIGQGGGPDVTGLSITAENNQFGEDELTAPANTEVTLEFRNEDQGVTHNFSVYRNSAAANPIFIGELFAGHAVRVYTFRTPAPGSYFFRCDIRPDTMTGTFRVQ
jgi:hypothetical protein